MNKKKILLGIVALMLVCTLSVAGTLAYLTSQANDGEGVTNTFVAAGGGELVETFELKEHALNQNADGTYTLDNAKFATEGNEYQVLPGIELPKDPTVMITGKTEAPAYLYIEIVGTLDEAIFEWSVDANWTKLDGVTGPNGGDVYAYKEDAIIDDTTTELSNIGIIAGNKITVKSDADTSALVSDEAVQLKFYGYMAQASIGTPAKAFEECFSASVNP